MKRLLLAAVAALLALGVGLYVVIIRPALAPSDDAALAERALVTPDVVVLAHVNVPRAVVRRLAHPRFGGAGAAGA